MVPRGLIALLFISGLAGCGGALQNGSDQPAAQGASTAPTASAVNSPDDFNATGTIQTTSSGLQYIDLAPGSGSGAAAGQTVTVHYTGWLTNGTKFDSSRDRGQPFAVQPLGAGRVIKGWDEGLVGMKVGGRRKLIIPPDLGYGSQGSPPVIPPNATLVFVVEVLSIQ